MSGADLSAAPSACSVCGTAIPAGATRCPGCGAVFGEANRCPHCHAIAAVRPTKDGLVCMACGKPRSGGPGVTVFEQPEKGKRKFRLGRLAFGAALSVGGVLASVLIGGTVGTLAGVGMLVVGLGTMGLTLARGTQEEGALGAALEQRIIKLAEKNAGVLYVSDVAEGLHVTSERADEILTAMADGTRVMADVTADGLMVYEFREITERRLATGGPRVRVADPLEERFAELEEELAARGELEKNLD